ncbi:DNA glycosylase [Amylostereum chailletii]|nr:DNA glycosylase [Amylostereum chailletii]
MSAIPPGFRALPLPLAQLSLAAVLKCGQSFRWSVHPVQAADGSTRTHEYRLCLRDRVVCLRQSPDILLYRSVFPDSVPIGDMSVREAETLAWIKDYFQLDIDLIKLYHDWAEKDAVFARVKARFEGIRMLRQDPWENLISFICSSNNNISRITKMVKSLCSHYSPPLLSLSPPAIDVDNSLLTPPHNSNHSICPKDVDFEPYHPFPPPSRLAMADVPAILRSLGFGYRADYIHKTAKMLVDAHKSTTSSQAGDEAAERWLRTLRKLPTAEAREELLKFMGVGRKVADCVLLMSLDKHEVIPVDTHVHQIAIKHYGLKGPLKARQTLSLKLYDEINSKFTSVWGEHAGWAHSVLFTADLKSFSSHGLPTPSPSPQVPFAPRASESEADHLPTLSQRTKKRKRAAPSNLVIDATTSVQGDTGDLSDTDTMSLVDRVKGRRRSVKSG